MAILHAYFTIHVVRTVCIDFYPTSNGFLPNYVLASGVLCQFEALLCWVVFVENSFEFLRAQKHELC